MIISAILGFAAETLEIIVDLPTLGIPLVPHQLIASSNSVTPDQVLHFQPRLDYDE